MDQSKVKRMIAGIVLPPVLVILLFIVAIVFIIIPTT